MKTTVEIPDPLFREAKQFAARHNLSLREVFERGVRTVVENEPVRARRFRLKAVTTKGEGLACDADWGTVRSMIYEGHGG